MSTVRPAALDRYGPLIEARLKRAVGERAALLAQMLRYQLGWTDRAGLPGSSAPDRPHGVLCLLAAEAADGPRDAAITAAAAIELVRGFYRVHRDLREGDPGLPDSPALWWTWGYAQGINAGDALYAQARLALMEATEDGLSPEAVLDACLVLDRGCLDLALAQHTLIEIEEQDRPDPAGYTQAVERTDGRLAATAAARSGPPSPARANGTAKRRAVPGPASARRGGCAPSSTASPSADAPPPSRTSETAAPSPLSSPSPMPPAPTSTPSNASAPTTAPSPTATSTPPSRPSSAAARVPTSRS